MWVAGGRITNKRSDKKPAVRGKRYSYISTLIGRPIRVSSTVSMSQDAFPGSVDDRIQRPDQCRFLKTYKTEDETARASVNRRDEPLAKTLRLNHNQSTGRLHKYEA